MMVTDLNQIITDKTKPVYIPRKMQPFTIQCCAAVLHGISQFHPHPSLWFHGKQRDHIPVSVKQTWAPFR